VTATNGQVGNLGLTDQQENDIVAFMAILSDGFLKPKPSTEAVSGGSRGSTPRDNS